MRTSIVGLLLALLAAPVAAQERLPILDVHLHAVPADHLGPPPVAMCTPMPYPAWDPSRPYGEMFGELARTPPCPDPVWSPMTDEALMNGTIEVMERLNIVGVLSGEEPERIAAWMAAAPGRFIPGLVLGFGPAGAGFSTDSLRSLHAAGRLAVLGEVINQYAGIAPDDARMAAYWALAEELDIPVGIHVGPGPPGAIYLGAGGYRGRLHSPLTMEEVLVRHPRLRVYLMHAGYPMLDDLLAVLYAHPQVYVDVGIIVFQQPRDEFYRYLREVVQAGFGDRVMFGSDQIVWPGVIERAVAVIEEAPFLTEAQKRDILYNNASRFLRLSDEEIARHHRRGGPANHLPDREENSLSGGVQCLTKTTLSERLRFADIDRAREILGRSDEWARQLSAFDRGVRQRTLEPTNTRGFLEFVSGEAAAWTQDEQVYWKSLVDQLSEALEGLNLDIPDSFMVKTTGVEEFNAVYVRNRSIIFPQGRIAVAGDVRRDFFLLAHELFHLLSLEYPARRYELYALLGFRRYVGFEYPAELEDRRLSNPMYGSRYEYVLTVQAASGPVDVTPAYQAAVPLEEFIAISEDGMSMGAFFEAIDFVLLPVDTGTRAVLRDGSGYPIIYHFGDTDWIERMQRNSSYIIHPDEVMAENFALLMEWRRSGTVPESVPGGPGAGFPVNDIGLLEEIQKVLTAGCGE